MQAINELIQAAINYDENNQHHDNQLAKIHNYYVMMRTRGGMNDERAQQFIERIGNWWKFGLAYEQLRVARRFDFRPQLFLYFQTNHNSQSTLKVISRLVYNFAKRLMLERFRNSQVACEEIGKCIITDPYLRVYYMECYHGLTDDRKTVGYTYSFPDVVELEMLNGYGDVVFDQVLTNQFHDLIFYVFKNKPLNYVIKLFLNIILLIHDYGLEAVISTDYFRMMVLNGNDLLPRNDGNNARYQRKLRRKDGSRHIRTLTHEQPEYYLDEPDTDTTFMFPENLFYLHKDMVDTEYGVLNRLINSNRFHQFDRDDLFGGRVFAFQHQIHVSMLFNNQHNNLEYDYDAVKQFLKDNILRVETLNDYLGIGEDEEIEEVEDEEEDEDDNLNEELNENPVAVFAENIIENEFIDDDEDDDFGIDPEDNSEGGW